MMKSKTAETSRVHICVLGLGYIGLPTASIFATKGLNVRGVDILPEVVETINRGSIHIEEPDLDVMVRAAVQSGNLVAHMKPCEADNFIIAVPTPFVESENSRVPNLSFVQQATRSIGPHVRAGNLVVVESTCPVGTTEKVRDWLADELRALGSEVGVDQLYFVHCPERVLPGQMLTELVTNDRIAGGLTTEAALKAKMLYETFCTAAIHLTDARTAELAKLTENASRDVGIAFANELSLICDALDINVWELIKLANHHPRVNILKPGPGVGGHCIAVDPWFIVDAAPDVCRLIRMARETNDAKPRHVIAQVLAKAERFKRPVVACFGLSFKADVDDLRESPACDIASAIGENENLELLIVEPHVKELPQSLKGRARLVKTSEALETSDIVVLLVDHREFAKIDRARIQDKVVIDTRGLWA